MMWFKAEGADRVPPRSQSVNTIQHGQLSMSNIRVEAVATMLEAIAIRLEAIATNVHIFYLLSLSLSLSLLLLLLLVLVLVLVLVVLLLLLLLCFFWWTTLV